MTLTAIDIVDVAPWWVLIISLSIAAGALIMTLVNLRFFQQPRSEHSRDQLPSIAVCIPARNEERNIEACIRSIQTSDYPDLRIYVYDDQSVDGTSAILSRLREQDPRIRTVPTRPLPQGWVGKQWACHQLGQTADAQRLLFIDADVRLERDCLASAVAAQDALGAALLSTFPRQITRSVGETLLVPMIFFILFSYLPFGRMRRSKDPNASAACGQFILIPKQVYLQLLPHAACRNSMHEGVKMPRVFRRAGLHTDLFDGTSVVSCRMYEGFVSTWRGFAKNAYEGLSSPVLLVLLTLLHLVGHVLPWIVLVWTIAAVRVPSIEFGLSLAAVLVTLVQRCVLAHRFGQSFVGAAAHPLSVLLMTVLQWHSFALSLAGRRGWRGRTMSAPDPSATTAAEA